MSLKDKLRLKSAPPAIALVDAGEDVLELHVSRNDISAGLLKRMREPTKAWENDDTPADELPEEEQSARSLAQADGAAVFVAGVVVGYRLYPQGSPEEAKARKAPLQKLTEADILDLPTELMGAVVTAVSSALSPTTAPSGAPT